MDLDQYLRSLRVHWRIIALSLLVSVALAGAITLRTTPIYAASSQLFVSTSSAESLSNAVQANVVAQERVVSYAELLQGQQLAQRVVDELQLVSTAEELASQVTTAIVPDSVILVVTVSDPSPEQAQLLVNTIANEFVGLVADLETLSATTSTDSSVDTTVTVAPVKVTVVQVANLPSSPILPSPVSNLALGAVLGLLIGIAVALLLDLLDNTVKSGSQVEELTGRAAVGGVLFDQRMVENPVITDYNLHSSTGESYRQIRTNLQYVRVDHPPKVMVITSSVGGEGKTTTAINLAIVLAQSGQRVVLVEADLRRPRVTRYMRLVGGAGLTNVLAGNADLLELLQPYGDGKLTVLAAGPHPPNPSELLGSELMGSLLSELRRHSDYVIIDAPPLLPVTDAAVLAVLADGAVIVTRYGKTKREQLRAAAASLHSIDAQLIGTVLNRIAVKRGGRYGYGYGYGYEYQADPNPRLASPTPRGLTYSRSRTKHTTTGR